jgi:Flp pilus assembly pilin Flp
VVRFSQRILARIHSDDRGANVLEYAMVLSAIIVFAAFAVGIIGRVTAGNIDGVNAGF